LLFAAKSTKGIKRLTLNERKAINIDTDTMSAITGMLLSDGHIAQRSKSSNARFIFSQSANLIKREYFELVLTLMKPFCTANYKPYIKNWIDSKTNINYSSISLTTMQLPCFVSLRTLWYINGIKKVPLNIQELLTPIALAHWIMGDGSRQNNGLHLSVYAFSIDNVNILIKALTEKYNVKCTIHQTKNGPRIYIDKTSMNLLRPIISPYIVASLKYKIDNR